MEIKLFVAVKAFIEKDGKVLVVREASTYDTGTNLGKFDLVGGRINVGEKLEDALRREAQEEIGAAIEVDVPFFADESLPRPVIEGEECQIIKIFFRSRLIGENIALSKDHDSYKWILPKDYKDSGLIPNLYQVFEAYLRT